MTNHCLGEPAQPGIIHFSTKVTAWCLLIPSSTQDCILQFPLSSPSLFAFPWDYLSQTWFACMATERPSWYSLDSCPALLSPLTLACLHAADCEYLSPAFLLSTLVVASSSSSSNFMKMPAYLLHLCPDLTNISQCLFPSCQRPVQFYSLLQALTT